MSADHYILAIDGGTEKSAWVLYNPETHVVEDCNIESNESLRDMLASTVLRPTNTELVLEWVSCYGMPVGDETFQMVYWLGRFAEAWEKPVHRIKRTDIKLQLCGSARAKDANVRQALLDRFPPTGGGRTPQVGTSKKPGPLYGARSHIWSAIAVAVAWWEYRNDGRRRWDAMEVR